MSDGLYIFCVGMLMGAVLIAGVSSVIPASVLYQYNHAIDECEVGLPRNQHCEIFARAMETETLND